jgi:uncharacterized protein (DUF433 family)
MIPSEEEIECSVPGSFYFLSREAQSVSQRGLGKHDSSAYVPILRHLLDCSSAFDHRHSLCPWRLDRFELTLAMGSEDWIEINADVCNGRPVLRGTRIAVQSVLEMLAAGDSVEDVLEAFPSLRREQVLACLDHAARLMGNRYSFEPVS